MGNRQGDVDLRFAQVSAPVRTLAWLKKNSYMTFHSDEWNIETIETDEEVPQNDNIVCENAVDEKVQCFTAKFESLHQAF